MRISLRSIWAPGAGSVALISPVLGGLVGGASAFGMDASGSYFFAEGQFVMVNAVMGAVLGAFMGAFVLIPAGVVWTGLFAWLMVRRHRSGEPSTRSIRWQAVSIAGAVQLVAMIQFVWAMTTPSYDDPGSLTISGTLLFEVVALLILMVGVAALLGPWLVQRAERRAADPGAEGLPVT